MEKSTQVIQRYTFGGKSNIAVAGKWGPRIEDVGVSKNNGTPKSSILIGVFHYFHHPFCGVNTTIFGSTPMYFLLTAGDVIPVSDVCDRLPGRVLSRCNTQIYM